MSKRTKSLLLGLFSGVIAFGVNAGMDYLNEREPDFTLYIINFFLWALLIGFGTYFELVRKKK